VGKPGVDERLQTGRNPIWVDNHSLLGYDGTVSVGQEFKDKQGRSVVIVANTKKLSPEPSIADCPPVTPPTTPVPTTTTPAPTETTTEPSPTTTTTEPSPTPSTTSPVPTTTTTATQPAGQVKASVVPNKLSCTVADAKALVTVGQQSSIGYAASKSALPTWVKREVPAGKYTVEFPDIAKGASASWYVVVSSLDDSMKPAWLGPYTFHRPSAADCKSAVVTPQPSASTLPGKNNFASFGTGAQQDTEIPWSNLAVGFGLMLLFFSGASTVRAYARKNAQR
jgi:hypothetical protein